MANLSYTPGPWHLGLSQSGRRFIYSSRGEQPLMPNVKLNKTGVTREMEANALLMAAAPEMLEALKRLYVQIDRMGYTREEDSFMEAARAAIAKAEGRS